MKHLINKTLKKFGYQITRFPIGVDLLKKELLQKRKIDLVVDVGANAGQFSRHLRDIGYNGRIMSFEPLINEFNELKLNSEKDSSWDVYNFAFGNEDTELTINVAGNSFSSSFLEMNSRHIESAPHSKYVGIQKVKMKKVNTFFDENPELSKYNIFLKLDVQGFEKNVVLGADKVLNKIKVIQLELSFEELYKGETLFFDMVEFLKEKKYYISLVTPEFTNPDNDKLLQVDTVFLRE